jgi:hypothetical protein
MIYGHCKINTREKNNGEKKHKWENTIYNNIRDAMQGSSVFNDLS